MSQGQAMPNIFEMTQTVGGSRRYRGGCGGVMGGAEGVIGGGQVVLVVAVVIVMIMLIAAVADAMTPTLSQELAKGGWVLYTREGCKFCVAQQAVLKGYWRTVKCSADGTSQKVAPGVVSPLSCDDKQIRGYPFWYNERRGLTRTGLQNVAALKQMVRDV